LFNVVLDTGIIPETWTTGIIIPETWTTGIIIPVYKNKGCPTDPDNFRAITLMYHFLTVLSVQMHIFIYIFDNLYLKSYGILLLLYSLYFYLHLISLYLSDIDKNTITTDQLNGLVTDLGHVLLDTAQKLQGKVKSGHLKT
jgi:hypothetical protein